MPDTKIAIPEARVAMARMYVELTKAIHASTFPAGQVPGELDANQAAVAATVMLGHAEGLPRTATEIASCLNMPRTSVSRRLNALIKRGMIRRINDRYYLEPVRAANVPHRDRFELILSQGFAVIGPHLSKMDTASEMDA
jgi:hypothetical protein